MDNNFVFSPISLDQIKSELSEAIKKEFQTYLSNIQPPKELTQNVTRKEAARFLNISLPTLNEWTKEGKVKGYRIGSRVRYKLSELEESLIEIKTKNQRRAA